MPGVCSWSDARRHVRADATLGGDEMAALRVGLARRYGPGDQRLIVLDFKRAFLYADCERELYAELPEECEKKRSGDAVRRLRKALYGTQDAPVLWQRLMPRIMFDHGFEAPRTTA